MRRPRPHRLTGSVRRLLAAALLAGLAAAFAVTSATRPVSAAGLGLNLNVGLGALNLNLPGLPSLLPTPNPPPPPSTSTPGLPGGASLPVVCPPSCATGAGPTNGGTSKRPANARSGAPSNPSGSSSGGGSSPFGSSQFGSSLGSAGTATSTVSVQQSAGLAVSPPPPVEQLTPLAGISFGQAPYLWPLFILLDVIAAAAVVLLVRRTWSPTSGAD